MATIAELVREAFSHWDDAAVLSRTGRELHDRNRLDVARDVLTRSLELDPQDHEAWAHLAYTHLRGYAPAQGLEVLRQGAKRTGRDQLRATLAAFTQDQEERAALMDQMSGNEDPEIRAWLASMKVYAGEEGAFREVRRLAEEHFDSSPVRMTFLWTVLGTRARGLEKEPELYEVAIPMVDREIADDSDRMMGHWMKAQLYLVDKDWDSLLLATNIALTRFPDDETMMYLRGRAYKEKGDVDRAAVCFARAVGMKHSYATARAELGKIYEEKGNVELAEETFRAIPIANPEFSGGLISLALFLGRRDRWDEAETLFLKTWAGMEPWAQARVKQQPDNAPLFERPRIKEIVGES